MKIIVAMLVALAIAALGISSSAYADEECTKWNPGAAPFAKTEAEAMRKLSWELRLWVARGKVTAEEAVLIEKHIRAHPEGDVPAATIAKGHRFAWMASGEVEKPLISNLCFDPEYKGKNRDGKPLAYTALVGAQWTVQLPTRVILITRPNLCYNWAGEWVSVPKPAPSLECYKIPLNYRQTPGVTWDKQHAVRIEIHFDGLYGADLERLVRDPCFKVSDVTGEYSLYRRCDVCESSGGQWPPAGLAKAVGLPEKEPQGIFTAPVQNGVGIVSLPYWATAYLGVYCVDVEEYEVSVRSYVGWGAVSRFDLVTPVEMKRTLSTGRLNRTLSGALRY